MSDMATAEDRGGKELLARFPRRNFKTGADEELRYEVGEFKGKLLTSARIWYRGGRPNGDDDGFRPSKDGGLTFREYELDGVIAALEGVRDRVRAEGRSTSPEPRPARGSSSAPEWRSEAALPQPSRRRQPETPVILPDDDQLDEAERRRKAPWEPTPDA